MRWELVRTTACASRVRTISLDSRQMHSKYTLSGNVSGTEVGSSYRGLSALKKKYNQTDTPFVLALVWAAGCCFETSSKIDDRKTYLLDAAYWLQLRPQKRLSLPTQLHEVPSSTRIHLDLVQDALLALYIPLLLDRTCVVTIALLTPHST